MIIDIHTHVFPDRIAAVAVDKLKKASRTTPFSDGKRSGLLDSMRRAGIGRSVVLPVVTNPVKASSINDVSIAQNGEDGLIWFGGIHPDTPDAAQELARIAAEGLKGVKIHPVYQGVDIDDPRFLRILTKCGELGLTVLMHAGDDIGFPGEVRCAPRMTARALAQAGPVRLICAHMGGWRNWSEVTDCLYPTSAMLDTAFCLGELSPLTPADYPGDERHMMKVDIFSSLVRDFGAERVLFGSDSPWDDQGAAVRRIMDAPLTPAQRDAILGANAQRLLGCE